MPKLTPHEIAEKLSSDFPFENRNEADTRHQIIDTLLHDILAWPKAMVKCEKHVHPGYMDYLLKDKADRARLVIEAKKEGKSFDLPRRIKTLNLFSEKVIA